MHYTIVLACEAQDLTHAQAEAVRGNSQPLRRLCQKEVDAFDRALRAHPDYADGLVKIERLAVEGYLYQKLRGHLDAHASANPYLEGRQDGTP